MTNLLRCWSAGDQQALERLIPVLYAELHRTARAYMRRERVDHTLQATALLNEAFLRIVNVHETNWEDRTHFFKLASQMMRRILVDHARSRQNLKRGGAARQISLEESAFISPSTSAGLVALDDALQALEKVDARKARVVELRFFGGMSVEETAAALNVSPQTVLRDWKLSKSWLMREMSRVRNE